MHRQIHQGGNRIRADKWMIKVLDIQEWIEYEFKFWIFNKWLRVDYMFCEKLKLEGARSLTDLLISDQIYINYKK